MNLKFLLWKKYEKILGYIKACVAVVNEDIYRTRKQSFYKVRSFDLAMSQVLELFCSSYTIIQY
jgi:hypothetical protein